MTQAAMIQPQRAETLARMQAERRVLGIQDTTSRDLRGHPGTDGRGPLEKVLPIVRWR